MRKATVVLCTLTVMLCGAFAVAQAPPADTLKVDYFANVNGSVDQTLRLTNPGTSGGPLCAAIYVFKADQELSECCSCYLSPDGLRTLSVNADLSSNPLTGTVATGGVIKIVSTTTVGGVCPLPTGLTPTPAVRAWSTHLQNNGTLTETGSADATLSANEVSRLKRECYAVKLVGSGHGVCSCGTGD